MYTRYEVWTIVKSSIVKTPVMYVSVDWRMPGHMYLLEVDIQDSICKNITKILWILEFEHSEKISGPRRNNKTQK